MLTTIDVDIDVPCNMSEICRLCLSKDGGILPIFGEEESGNQNVPLSFRILACVSVEVSIISLTFECIMYCTFSVKKWVWAFES